MNKITKIRLACVVVIIFSLFVKCYDQEMIDCFKTNKTPLLCRAWKGK